MMIIRSAAKFFKRDLEEEKKQRKFSPVRMMMIIQGILPRKGGMGKRRR
jgi:hypothetical protein